MNVCGQLERSNHSICFEKKKHKTCIFRQLIDTRISYKNKSYGLGTMQVSRNLCEILLK